MFLPLPVLFVFLNHTLKTPNKLANKKSETLNDSSINEKEQNHRRTMEKHRTSL